MSKPSILPSLYVKLTESGEFGVFSTAKIARDSTIEFCAWIPISQKTQLLLKSHDAVLDSRLFVNPEGISKEREIGEKLAELDLQERLDRGLITTEQFKAIVYLLYLSVSLLTIQSYYNVSRGTYHNTIYCISSYNIHKI
jgi:hypothetical protein